MSVLSVRRGLGYLAGVGVVVLGTLGYSQIGPNSEATDGSDRKVDAAVGTSGEKAPSPRETREILAGKLQRPVKINFEKMALTDVLKQLANSVEMDVVIDETAIDEEGLSIDQTVNIVMQNTTVSAREALDLLLEPYYLKAVNDDGVLLVTTTDAAGDMLYIVAYDLSGHVAAILRDDDALTMMQSRAMWAGEQTNRLVAGETPTKEAQLKAMILLSSQQMIMQVTPGPWMDIDGTGGTAQVIDQQLMVRQTEDNHLVIQDLLEQWAQNQAARVKK